MWVDLTRAGCCVVALGGSEKSRLVTASASARSDVPLLWRRLVVVAHSSLASSMTVSMRRCLSHLCHALQFCKLVPAWDPIHSSRLGSSLGCLAATGRVQWTLASPATVAGQCRERGELGRYPARTRTCHQQYGAWVAASVVSVARPGNNDHRPLRLAEWRSGEQPSFDTATETISDLLNVGRQRSKRTAAMLCFLVSRGA